MINVTITVDADILDALGEQVRRAPALVKGAVRRQVNKERQRLRAELKVTPGPPKYPLRWKSEKQRRAFFATNGFGKGIPYQRTGKMVDAWDLQTVNLPDGLEISAVNETAYARFVIGDDAQPFHLDTGWRQAAPTLANSRARLENDLIEIWYTLDDPRAGVRP
jgi:hypothetical protein